MSEANQYTEYTEPGWTGQWGEGGFGADGFLTTDDTTGTDEDEAKGTGFLHRRGWKTAEMRDFESVVSGVGGDSGVKEALGRAFLPQRG